MAKTHNNITTNTVSKFKLTEGRLVTFGLVGMVAAFGILLVFISGGAVRHVAIFWMLYVVILSICCKRET